MIRTSIISLFFFLLFISCRSTQENRPSWYDEPLSAATPESQGFIPDSLEEIDHLFQEYVDQRWIAGATALVARQGKIVYFRSTGYDDLENKILLEKDAIFRIASQTKAVASVAVMMLYEEGKIALNDPISKYLPIFNYPRVLETFNQKDTSFTTTAAEREVTIHNLLTHTSGYCYPGSGGEAMNAIYVKNDISGGVPDKGSTLKDEIQKIATLPLLQEPGEKFTYGLSTDILGYMVEVVSGQSLEKFFRSRIFDPLGMKDTYFLLPADEHHRLMNLYQHDSQEDKVKKLTGKYVDYPKRHIFYSGGGGLSSTTLDYAIFQQMLLNEGEYNGIRLLDRTTVKMMHENHIGDLGAGSLFIPGSPDKFGLGFEVITPPDSIMTYISQGSFGWGGAFGSLYWIDPSEDLIAHFVIQKAGPEHMEIRAKFIKAVYQAIEHH